MKTTNLLLLIAAGGGAVYFLTKKPAKAAIIAKPKPLELPAEKVPPKQPEKKPDLPLEKPKADMGFIYDCKTLTITNPQKAYDFINEDSAAVGEKLNITTKKTISNVNIPVYVDEVISRINKSCLKNPELMNSEEKISQTLIIMVYLNSQLQVIEQNENIPEDQALKIKQFLYEKLKTYYKITKDEETLLLKTLGELIPSKQAYVFNCNEFTVNNEKAMVGIFATKFIYALASQGFDDKKPETLFDISSTKAFIMFVEELKPDCSIDDMSDEVFIFILAMFISLYRTAVDDAFPNNLTAVTKSEEKIKEIYGDFELEDQIIQQIEQLSKEFLSEMEQEQKPIIDGNKFQMVNTIFKK